VEAVRVSLASRGRTGLERWGGAKVVVRRSLWPVISRLDNYLHFRSTYCLSGLPPHHFIPVDLAGQGTL
jgi:hypothetical protein